MVRSDNIVKDNAAEWLEESANFIEQLQAERDLVIKERDALKAKIDSGVMVDAWKNQFGHAMANEPGFGEGNEGCNATLIIDDGEQP